MNLSLPDGFQPSGRFLPTHSGVYPQAVSPCPAVFPVHEPMQYSNSASGLTDPRTRDVSTLRPIHYAPSHPQSFAPSVHSTHSFHTQYPTANLHAYPQATAQPYTSLPASYPLTHSNHIIESASPSSDSQNGVHRTESRTSSRSLSGWTNGTAESAPNNRFHVQRPTSAVPETQGITLSAVNVVTYLNALYFSHLGLTIPNSGPYVVSNVLSEQAIVNAAMGMWLMIFIYVC